MAKFKLVPAPTFKATVSIPVPGEAATPLQMTFKYRSYEAFGELMKSYADNTPDNVPMVLDLCEGWELAETFNEENVKLLLNYYPVAANLIWEKYLKENTPAKVGN